MSEKGMDLLPRMKDTLRPEDLNTDACANWRGRSTDQAKEATP